MTWSHPEHWWWLLLVPAMAGCWVWTGRRHARAMARFADPRMLPQLAGSVDHASRRLKAWLVMLGLFCLALALIGPQWGFRWQEVNRRGADLMIALDVSKSMLAEDLKPSRLARAKLAIQDLLPLLKGDRVGLVAFAGTGFIQCPLTTDYGAFALTLEDLGPDAIPRGGTAVAAAIRQALQAFSASGSSESKAIVLMTDGESHEGDAMAAAQEAARAGITIFTIGIGTPEGELIPLADEQGHRVFLKDREGRTVKSRLDEHTLQSIAHVTGGMYLRANPAAFGLDRLYKERIAPTATDQAESTRRKQPEQRFQWPLAVALLVLAGELLIADRKRASA